MKEKKRKEKVSNRGNWLIINVKVIQCCCWRTCLIKSQNVQLCPIATYLASQRWMNYTINLSPTNCQATRSYSKTVLWEVSKMNDLWRPAELASYTINISSRKDSRRKGWMPQLLFLQPNIPHRMIDHSINRYWMCFSNSANLLICQLDQSSWSNQANEYIKTFTVKVKKSNRYGS